MAARAIRPAARTVAAGVGINDDDEAVDRAMRPTTDRWHTIQVSYDRSAELRRQLPDSEHAVYDRLEELGLDPRTLAQLLARIKQIG